MRRRLVILVPCLLLVAIGATFACPVCHTGDGALVRAGIVDDNFARTLVAVLSSFPILVACVAMIHFGWPSWQRKRARTDDDD